MREATATAGSRTAAQALLKERLVRRPGYGTGGLLSLSSPFGDLVELWLGDLALRDISEGTKVLGAVGSDDVGVVGRADGGAVAGSSVGRHRGGFVGA